MAVEYEDDKKILLVEDTKTQLIDALADLMLIHGGDGSKVHDEIERAWSSAHGHYEAEKDGDSEGYQIRVAAQDGSRSVPLREWVTR
jgi:hypothetical protein